MNSIARTCKLQNCELKHKGLGYCKLHYIRYKNNGTTESTVIRNNDKKRFFSKVDKTNGCWLWTGQLNKFGYGKFFAKKKHLAAHRYSYELHNNTKLPPRKSYMCLDHICRIRHCVNPKHLELVTYSENISRGKVVSNKKSKMPIGVYFRSRKDYRVSKPYEVYKTRHGKTHYVGNFKTIDEAVTARNNF